MFKYLYLKGLTPKEIKAELDIAHGTSAPVFETVYNWVNEFKRGRTSTKDEHRSERPAEVTTPKKGQTTTEAYYRSLLHRLSEEIKKKCPYLKKRKILFHHDDARVDTCAVLMAKIMEFKFKLLQYSPDSAPGDLFLFTNFKKWLGGQRFASNKAIAQTDAYFEDLPKSYFLEGLKKLEKCLEKFVKRRLC